MRRPFFALPLLLALVVGALAGPSTAATAADETGTISGTVSYPGGALADVSIVVRSTSNLGSVSAKPDATGRWSATVPAGTYRTHFTGDKHVVRQAWGGAIPADVVVTAGGVVTGIDASLVRGGTVAALSTSANRPFQVHLLRQDGAAWIPTQQSLLISQSPWQAQFGGVEPGTYRLQVEWLPSGNSWGGRDAGVTPVPALQDQELVVTPGSDQALRVAAAPTTPLVQPTQKPGVHEPRRDGTFELSPGTWPSGTTILEQRWYSGESVMRPVDDAAGRAFTAGAQHHGHRVAVRTVVRRAGFADTVHWTETRDVMEPIDRDVAVSLGRTTADVETQAHLSGDWISDTFVVYHWYVDGKHLESLSSGRFRPPRSSSGKTLRVRVTQDFEGRRLSAETTVVVGATTRRVVNRPRIKNARVEGFPDVTDPWKIWSPAPDPYYVKPDFRFHEQWYLDGKPIARPYQLSWRYGGHRLHARVTLTQTGYQTATIDTPPVTVQLGRIYSATRPDLNTYMVSTGETLRASKGTWSVRPRSVRYQWYADKKPIKGATSSRLKVTKKLAGKRLRLKVTVGHPGYRSASRWSDTLRVNPWYAGQR